MCVGVLISSVDQFRNEVKPSRMLLEELLKKLPDFETALRCSMMKSVYESRTKESRPTSVIVSTSYSLLATTDVTFSSSQFLRTYSSGCKSPRSCRLPLRCLDLRDGLCRFHGQENPPRLFGVKRLILSSESPSESTDTFTCLVGRKRRNIRRRSDIPSKPPPPSFDPSNLLLTAITSGRTSCEKLQHSQRLTVTNSTQAL